MEFSKKKLPADLIPKLLRMKIETIRPFTFMVAPAYIFLRANAKLVPIKAPLDFFTQEELERLKKYEFLYFSNFVESVLPFQKAGMSLRQILNWNENSVENVPPIPYAVSDKILQILGPLWWDQGDGEPGIEPFLAAICANEVCELIPPSTLLAARERNVLKLDQALLVSNWSVFLALHLGYYDLDFLTDLRLRVFDDTMSENFPRKGKNEIEDIIAFAHSSLNSSRLHTISMGSLSERTDRVALKLKSRLERISSDFLRQGELPPTIFGERGFVDV